MLLYGDKCFERGSKRDAVLPADSRNDIYHIRTLRMEDGQSDMVRPSAETDGQTKETKDVKCIIARKWRRNNGMD